LAHFEVLNRFKRRRLDRKPRDLQDTDIMDDIDLLSGDFIGFSPSKNSHPTAASYHMTVGGDAILGDRYAGPKIGTPIGMDTSNLNDM